MKESVREMYTVTAAITTYKRPWNMIRRAADSVLGQTYPVAELLIIDDNDSGSDFSKNLKKAIENEHNDLIRYIPMKKNGGVGAARNKAISEAKGKYICFLDDDDEWRKDKIENQIALFRKNPALGIVFGTGWQIHSNGTEEPNWQGKIFKRSPSLEDMLWTDYVGSTSCPMLSLKALEDVGGFLDRSVQPAVEDYELWIRIRKRYPIEGIKSIVFDKYMDDEEHVSGNLYKVYLGFKNIYRINKADYKKYPKARVGILWNISRCGVRAKKIQVVPYVFQWFFWKMYVAVKRIK